MELQPASRPVNGNVSFWHHQLGVPEPGAPLPGDLDTDVAIVGAGYTGLWTAYYLKRARPDLQVDVLEARFAGFGASGRNGGWLAALDRALRRWPSERHELLDARQLAERVRVSGALGAVFLPQCARLNPAKLVRGLADVVRGLGVRIHERTRAVAVSAHTVVTDRGTVTARHVLRCTEGFTAQLDGHHRDWIPMNSSMIVTDPLPEAVWSQIGWQGLETVEDLAHAYVYLQRTADGRIALGGRGVPYRYGSRVDSDGSTAQRTIDALAGVLAGLFPAVVDAAGHVPVAHAWSGVLGVPRDWRPTVTYDPVTGLGHAGGYVGTGVTASNLAGRTLADLVLGEYSPRTRHPWVDHAGRRWEPEPLRYAGITALYRAYHLADAREATGRRRRTHPLARLADVISGR